MKKLVLLVVVLAAILALAACAPTSTTPLSTSVPPTAGSAVATPIAAATDSVAVTSEAVTATPDTRPIVPAPAADDSRPLAALTAAERNGRFSEPAETYVKPNTVYIATIVTDKGNIVAELYQDTPLSLNNFVTLAQNGFYDGLTFHRVVPGFVIQGGDPAGDGSGDSGYTIPAEIGHPHIKGALAWARTSDEVNPERASSGSQFYITLDDTYFLDGAYSVFGGVIDGLDVTEQIAMGDKIIRIDISTGTTSLLPTPGPTRTPAPTATPGPTSTPTATPTPYAPSAQDGRPLAALSVAEREGVYNTAPAMTLDTTKTYQATIETDKGQFVIDLDAELAPISVNNFVLLANLGYYDGMPVAFAEPGVYMIAGSPASMPNSDVGYSISVERPVTDTQIITGTVSLYPTQSLAGEVVASGSQFFVSFMAMEDNTTPLNVFGMVSSGLDVVQQLVAGDIITKITISEK